MPRCCRERDIWYIAGSIVGDAWDAKLPRRLRIILTDSSTARIEVWELTS